MFVYTIGDIVGLIFWGVIIGAAVLGWAATSIRGYLRSKRRG